MGKQIQYDINFNVNDTNLRKSMAALKQEISSLSTINIADNADEQLKKSVNTAKQLQSILRQSYDKTTNEFNLSKFNQALKTQQTSIAEVGKDLMSLGGVGTSAFNNLANAITKAEIPAKRTFALFDNFKKTLMTSLNYTLSYGVINQFSQGIRSAVNYAKDLDSSLNRIRVVTGESAAQMDKLAQRANQAAKQLSSTTLDYTNASLIYYQQGLNDEEVAKRTETTIKMANVLGESASQVSDYMTAIWNNFKDGSKSLEYYGDAITALGAKTAASSKEIADGLGKFAAVADTVGLSYEYATAALATVVAETRQSAETVGTAFKTIFSRMEQLKQGGTTEEGDTTLGQYSKALEKIGVNIKTASGELKSMDQILMETGNAWKTLSNDQQVALAQTVAGVRQYSQFIALMKNWDEVVKNAEIAADSEGTLNQQQEIFAESWEAAANRTKASVQELYSQILDSDFLIQIQNLLTTLTNGASGFVKSMGGIGNVLTGIGGILISNLLPQINQGVNNITTNLLTTFGITQAGMINTKKELLDLISGLQNSNSEFETMKVRLEQSLLSEDVMNSNFYTEDTKSQFLAYKEEIEELLSLLDQFNQEEAQAREIMNSLMTPDKLGSVSQKNMTEWLEYTVADNEAGMSVIRDKIKEQFNTITSTAGDSGADIAANFANAMKEGLDQSKIQLPEYFESTFNDIIDNLKSGKLEQVQQQFEQLGLHIDVSNFDNIRQAFEGLSTSIFTSGENSIVYQAFMESVRENTNLTDRQIRQLIQAFQKLSAAQRNAEDTTKKYEQALKNQEEALKKNQISIQQWISGMAGALMNISTLINSVTSLMNIWKDDSKSFGEKITSSLMSVSMIATSVMSLYKNLEPIIGSRIAKINLETLALKNNTKAQIENNLAKQGKSLPGGEAGGTPTPGTGDEITKDIKKQASSTITSILILITVLSILFSFIKNFIDKLPTLEKDIEKSNKSLEEATKLSDQATKAYTEASKAVDDLNKSLEKNNNIENDLSSKIKGTQEYTKAIKENNASVIELLDSYGMLKASNYDIGANGEYKITESAQLQMQAQAQDNLTTAQINQAQAKITQKNIQKENDRLKMLQKVRSEYGKNTNKDELGYWSSNIATIGAGAVLGIAATAALSFLTLPAVAAAAVGAVVAKTTGLSDSIGELGKEFVLKKYDKESEKLVDALLAEPTKTVAELIKDEGLNLSKEFKNLVSSSKDLQKAFEDTAKAQIDADNSKYAYAKESAAGYVDQTEPNLSPEEREAKIIAIADATVSKETQTKAEEQVSKLSNKELADRFAANNKYEVKKVDKEGVTFYDGNGNTIEYGFSAIKEAITQSIIQDLAQEADSNEVKDFKSRTNNIKNLEEVKTLINDINNSDLTIQAKEDLLGPLTKLNELNDKLKKIEGYKDIDIELLTSVNWTDDRIALLLKYINEGKPLIQAIELVISDIKTEEKASGKAAVLNKIANGEAVSPEELSYLSTNELISYNSSSDKKGWATGELNKDFTPYVDNYYENDFETRKTKIENGIAELEAKRDSIQTPTGIHLVPSGYVRLLRYANYSKGPTGQPFTNKMGLGTKEWSDIKQLYSETFPKKKVGAMDFGAFDTNRGNKAQELLNYYNDLYKEPTQAEIQEAEDLKKSYQTKINKKNQELDNLLFVNDKYEHYDSENFQNKLLTGVDTFDKLQKSVNAQEFPEAVKQSKAYREGLRQLAAQYPSCISELQSFETAQKSGNKEAKATTQKILEQKLAVVELENAFQNFRTKDKDLINQVLGIGAKNSDELTNLQKDQLGQVATDLNNLPGLDLGLTWESLFKNKDLFAPLLTQAETTFGQIQQIATQYTFSTEENLKNSIEDVSDYIEGDIDEITRELLEATNQGKAFADIDFSNPKAALQKIAEMYNSIEGEGAKAAFIAAVFANTANRDVVTNWIINRVFSDGDIKQGTGDDYYTINKELSADQAEQLRKAGFDVRSTRGGWVVRDIKGGSKTDFANRLNEALESPAPGTDDFDKLFGDIFDSWKTPVSLTTPGGEDGGKGSNPTTTKQSEPTAVEDAGKSADAVNDFATALDKAKESLDAYKKSIDLLTKYGENLTYEQYQKYILPEKIKLDRDNLSANLSYANEAKAALLKQEKEKIIPYIDEFQKATGLVDATETLTGIIAGNFSPEEILKQRHEAVQQVQRKYAGATFDEATKLYLDDGNKNEFGEYLIPDEVKDKYEHEKKQVEKTFDSATQSGENFKKAYQAYLESLTGGAEEINNSIKGYIDYFENSLWKNGDFSNDNQIFKDIMGVLVSDFEFKALEAGLEQYSDEYYKFVADLTNEYVYVPKIKSYYEQAGKRLDSRKNYNDSQLKKFETYNDQGSVALYNSDKAIKSLEAWRNNNDELYDFARLNAHKGYFDMSTGAILWDNIKNTEDYTYMLDLATKSQEGFNDALTSMADIYSQLSNAINTYTDKMDRIQSLINHSITITNTLKGIYKDFGRSLNGLINTTIDKNNQIISNNLQNLYHANTKLYRDEYETLKTRYNELLEQQVNATEDNKKAIDEAINEVEDKILDTQEKIFESINDEIQNIKETFETAIDDSVDNIMAKIAQGFGNLDSVISMMDLFDKFNEQYLSTNQKIYNLNKMMRTGLADLSKATSQYAKNNLNEVITKIDKARQSSTKMSENELKILQAQYEIALAKNALYEVSNNATKMNLQRDANGNWSYVYTADQEAIDAAQQKLEDERAKLTDELANQEKQLRSDVISNVNEYIKKRQEIMKDVTITDEERENQLAELDNYGRRLYETSIKEYRRVVSEQGITLANSPIMKYLDVNGLSEGIDEYIGNQTESYDKYRLNLKKIINDNGLQDVEGLINQFGVPAGIEAKISEAVDELNNNVSGIYQVLNCLFTEFLKQKYKDLIPQSEIIDQIGVDLEHLLTNSEEAELNELIAKAQTAEGLTQEEQARKKELEELQDWRKDFLTTYGNIINLLKGIRSQISVQQQFVPQTVESFKPQTKTNADYDTRSRAEKLAYEATKDQLMSDEDRAAYAKYLASLDSGGYTGAFGSEGRLALLHEKELVLNKEDTANILSAVDIVRQMARTIDENILASVYSLGSLLSAPSIGNLGKNLDQNVHIEANFPNVSEAREIELALNNLVNEASQYAQEFK